MGVNDLLSPEDRLAVIAGKLSASTIRILGAGMASNLPGRFARKFSTNILRTLSSKPRLGVVAVTGTNGKSTSTGLLASILKESHKSIVHNRQGANLVTGITASLVNAANWNGAIDADYGLFEIDEAALPVIAKEINLSLVLVTNLFRDQLDRFGELDTTGKLIAEGLKQNQTKAILNADDPNVCQLMPPGKAYYYGINLDDSVVDNVYQPAELSYCPACDGEITYQQIFYGQLGHWQCSSCNLTRPEPNVFATNIQLESSSSSFSLITPQGNTLVELNLPGLFNVYNAVAASAAALLLNCDLSSIQRGLENYSTLFGRSERLQVLGKAVLIQLIKNPAGATQSVQAFMHDQRTSLLIAINDNLADGRDISWLWDAQFEPLAQSNAKIITSGQRAEDMSVRLKYANVKESAITCISSLNKALLAALTNTAPDGTLWILPTYTCLLELQKILKKMGLTLSDT